MVSFFFAYWYYILGIGWPSIGLLLAFRRMRKHGESLTSIADLLFIMVAWPFYLRDLLE